MISRFPLFFKPIRCSAISLAILMLTSTQALAQQAPVAQPQAAESSAPSADALPEAPAGALEIAPPAPADPKVMEALKAFETALTATPPERSKAAKNLAEMPMIGEAIDAWIAQTTVDHPQNLIAKDLLTAMPIKLAGPRLTELAKKSSDPAIQRNWENWLQKYPDAYASVLVAWLRLSNTNPPQFTSLLNKYAALRPDDALNIWAQLIASYPISELEHIAKFGLHSENCVPALAKSLQTLTEDTAVLRTFRALTKCETTRIPEDHADLASKVRARLDAESISQRIAAIDLAGHLRLTDQNIPDALAAIYKDAKNTTERASALRALDAIAPDDSRVADALENGDETLRFTASELIFARKDDAIPTDSIERAFAKELWPDTQLYLYKTLARRMPDSDDKIAFQKRILMDNTRAEAIRLAALADLSAKPGNVKLDDMAALQKQEAPLDLIASTAEHIYKTTPDARPTLRTWLNAQQPFERRILATFARFMQIDQTERDTGAIESMRKVCAESHENILQVCINYFESNAQNDADKALLEDLRRRKAQIDAMMNLEF